MFGYKNAALFCTKNSVFEILSPIKIERRLLIWDEK
nr:MAG TPA: hypothetical protein [Caudoviricetes sp.]